MCKASVEVLALNRAPLIAKLVFHCVLILLLKCFVLSCYNEFCTAKWLLKSYCFMVVLYHDLYKV